jgi:uncharacterized protein (TIGR01777 family)
MKILLVGGSGLIGEALKPYLQSQGHEVHVLSRKIGGWNPEAGYLPNEALMGYECIINLAGHSLMGSLWTKKQKEKILQSRLVSTQLLVKTIQTLDVLPKIFISASAVGYYGSTGNEEVTEEHAAGSGFLAEVCAKWEREAAVLQGVRCAIMRIGVVLTPKGGVLKLMLPLFRLALGGRLGTGDHWMSWIAMEDLVRLFGFVLDNPNLSGPINATSPYPVTNRIFTETLAKVVRRPAFLHVPAWFLRLLPGKQADDMLLIGARVIPAKAIRAGFCFEHQNLEQALKQIV